MISLWWHDILYVLESSNKQWAIFIQAPGMKSELILRPRELNHYPGLYRLWEALHGNAIGKAGTLWRSIS
jgi:hypothetical protein